MVAGLVGAAVAHAACAAGHAPLSVRRAGDSVELRVGEPPPATLAVVPLGRPWGGADGWPRFIDGASPSPEPSTLALSSGIATRWLVFARDADGATERALISADELAIDGALSVTTTPQRSHRLAGVVRTRRGAALRAQRIVALMTDALPYEDAPGQLACPACTAWFGSFAELVRAGAAREAASGEDGAFVLDLADGSWVVGSCDPSGACSDPVTLALGPEDVAPAPLELVGLRRRAVGIVVESDRGPMPGARIEIVAQAKPTESLAAGVADASGRWLAASLPMRDLLVRAKAPHHAPDEVVGAGEMPLRLTLLRCGSASGRVVDEGGAARRGVRVEALHVIPPSERMTPPRVEPTEASAVTDEAGAYRLDDLPTGRILMRASSPLDLPAVADALDVQPGASLVVPDLVLRPGSFVSGVVVDSESEEAIADATVGVVGVEEPSCLTDGEGRFRLGPLEPGATRLVAREAAHPPTPGDEKEVVVARAGDEDAVVELTLQPAATLEVRFVTATGEPVEGVKIQVSAAPTAQRSPTRTGVTDGDGIATFEDLPAGPARVGDLTTKIEEWATLSAGRVTRMTLVQRGTRIHGRILRDGQPAEAVVSLHDVDDFMYRVRGFTAPATTYAITGAMPPATQLVIVVPSPPVVDRETHWYIDYETVPIAEGDLDVEHDIVLRVGPTDSDEPSGGAWITGRVVDAVTQEPVPSLRVTGAGRTAGMSDARGRFSMGPVADGEYVLVARADWMRDAEMAGLLETESVDVRVESGRVISPASIVIRVKRGPVARLRVLSPSGRPVGGTVAWRIDRPLVVGGGSTGWSDASGVVTLHGNEVGAQPVLVVAPDGTVASLDVNFGGAEEQAVQLPRTGIVRATLPSDGVAEIRQSSWPRPITMYELDFGCRGCAWNDIEWGDGFRRIELRALPVGQVEIGTRSVTKTVLVRADEPIEVDLR